ncbi:MAG: GNAT family N-acetyltransferase [bacterium]|nr:GNAT family N-acetyltransferase [bacterium]
MTVNYFKRYRMEFDLSQQMFDRPHLPFDYELVGWDNDLVEDHADAKYRSFRGEIDANVFPSLGTYEGCFRLMSEISNRRGFCARSTWLLASQENGATEVTPCGTIQGIQNRHGFGLIQNIGVTPDHRGRSLGTSLIYEALTGFKSQGLRRASLEVTAFNEGAIRLYQRLGFAIVKTVYKAVEVAYV